MILILFLFLRYHKETFQDFSVPAPFYILIEDDHGQQFQKQVVFSPEDLAGQDYYTTLHEQEIPLPPPMNEMDPVRISSGNVQEFVVNRPTTVEIASALTENGRFMVTLNITHHIREDNSIFIDFSEYLNHTDRLVLITILSEQTQTIALDSSTRRIESTYSDRVLLNINGNSYPIMHNNYETDQGGYINYHLLCMFCLKVAVPLVKGWNLVSVPKDSILYEESDMLIYTYLNGSYHEAELLYAGLGYWIHATESRRFTVASVFTESDIDIESGIWNLLSLPNQHLNQKSIVRVYGWDAGRQKYHRKRNMLAELQDGAGYWIKFA